MLLCDRPQVDSSITSSSRKMLQLILNIDFILEKIQTLEVETDFVLMWFEGSKCEYDNKFVKRSINCMSINLKADKSYAQGVVLFCQISEYLLSSSSSSDDPRKSSKFPLSSSN